MTYTEEFAPGPDIVVDESPYPTAFGVTFTPPLVGGLLVALGLIAGLWLLFSRVLPTLQSNRDLAQQVEDSRISLEQQQQNLANRSEFVARQEAAIAEYDQAMDLFADPEDLDTLLLDISQQIPNPKGLLQSFSPEGEVEIVSEGLLGEEVNGMLKRQAYNVVIDGTYQETQDFLDSLERLDPLLLVQGIQTEAAELVQEVNVGPFGQVSINRQDPQLTTTLSIDALIERSREEFEADRQAAAAAADPAAAGTDPAAAGTDPAAAPE